MVHDTSTEMRTNVNGSLLIWKAQVEYRQLIIMLCEKRLQFSQRTLSLYPSLFLLTVYQDVERVVIAEMHDFIPLMLPEVTRSPPEMLKMTKGETDITIYSEHLPTYRIQSCVINLSSYFTCRFWLLLSSLIVIQLSYYITIIGIFTIVSFLK